MDVLDTYWVVSSNKYRDQLWRHICNTQLTFGAMASFACVGGFFFRTCSKVKNIRWSEDSRQSKDANKWDMHAKESNNYCIMNSALRLKSEARVISTKSTSI